MSRAPDPDLQAPDVICFGESMALMCADTPGDLARVERFTRRLAGADSNVAIGLARQGLRVHWLTRVGDDAFGRFIRDTLAREGIGDDGTHVDAVRPTAVMFKSRNDDGSDPQTRYYRAGSAASALCPDDLPANVIAVARHLHATGITAALSAGALALCHHAMDAMRVNGGSVSFDPNLRPSLWPDRATMARELNRLAAKADWLLAGLEEARQLTGLHEPDAIAAFYRQAGAREIVLKLGAGGAIWYGDREVLRLPAAAVTRVVDTVGAGDAFATGFISARLEGLTAREALGRANAFGAHVIQHAGDYEGLPHRDGIPATCP